jgi:phosphoribosylamine--glycine ligase
LVGDEISLFALCDGAHAIPLGAAQDHKRVGEGDTGPNTGGMGAYSPPPALTPALEADAMAQIIRPALAELARQGTPFRGILFAGLMVTADGVKLIEFNVRFGDPEAECLLPRLQSDLLPALMAACDGELADFSLVWRKVSALTVVLAARGYPGAPEKHIPIGSLAEAEAVPGALVFQSGTEVSGSALVSSSGRVLAITGTGSDLAAAQKAAYAAARQVAAPALFYRRDIGWRALGLPSSTNL